jgi:hypothetical protein
LLPLWKKGGDSLKLKLYYRDSRTTILTLQPEEELFSYRPLKKPERTKIFLAW